MKEWGGKRKKETCMIREMKELERRKILTTSEEQHKEEENVMINEKKSMWHEG